MSEHIFVGFGFGPIQSGLFVSEAFKSGNFSRIVISEIDQQLVDAVRANDGSYYVNIASNSGISAERIDGIEMLNPAVDDDRQRLIEALSQATEITTSLPSVDFYETGENSVVSLIKRGLENSSVNGTIIYAAENNNHAAEILERKVGSFNNVQYLNTVIGKMSQVLNDKAEIEEKQLKTIAPGLGRAFLVEEFNKILVTKCNIDGFAPGIKVFLEKDKLLPFEEAKLYGHNAIHALLAYLGADKGYTKMAQLADDPELMQTARDAFVKESGGALIIRYAHLNDELFTEAGYTAFAEDLLKRMTNPYLSDPIERAGRDPRRKLSPEDRIFGTMQLALEQSIEPVNIAKGAAAGIKYLAQSENRALDTSSLKCLLNDIWKDNDSKYKSNIIRLTNHYLI